MRERQPSLPADPRVARGEISQPDLCFERQMNASIYLLKRDIERYQATPKWRWLKRRRMQRAITDSIKENVKALADHTIERISRTFGGGV